MGKDLIRQDGEVIDNLSNGKYLVELDNGMQVICYIAGKLLKNKIKILVGDLVSVELSPYDLTNGRITFRKSAIKNEK